MSMVSSTELYAGSHDTNSTKLVDKLFHTFLSVGRLIVPNDEDWRKTGMVMAKLGQKYGFEAKYISKIQNDILIACSGEELAHLLSHRTQKIFRE